MATKKKKVKKVTKKEIQSVLKAAELRDKRTGKTHSLKERQKRLEATHKKRKLKRKSK